MCFNKAFLSTQHKNSVLVQMDSIFSISVLQTLKYICWTDAKWDMKDYQTRYTSVEYLIWFWIYSIIFGAKRVVVVPKRS